VVLPDGGYPFILVLYTTYNLIFPFRTRVPMWRAIWKVVTAPLHPPTFFHGYVGDIFTSFVKVFQDIAWTICWVFTGSFMNSDDLGGTATTNFSWSSERWYKNYLIPLICLFPLVVRFNQCLRRYIDTGERFPHLANATKYALSQTVTLFGAFHPLYAPVAGRINWFQIFWTLVYVTSSLYSFVWDVKMDWGLGNPQQGYLGESLMYPKRSYYYTIIALDLGTCGLEDIATERDVGNNGKSLIF
jgi:xenotropic and polytropic retrovirus receptor 1